MKTLAIIAVPLTLLAGCNTTQNERTWVGTTQLDAEYGAASPPSFRPTARPEKPLSDDGPSITSLLRPEWRTQVFVVPMDGVASQRTYAYELFYTDETARQRGQQPTTLSALELSGDTKWMQGLECCVNPFVAFGDAVLIPARMVAHAPWREVLSYPSTTYWRAPDSTPRRPVGVVPPPSGTRHSSADIEVPLTIHRVDVPGL